MIINMQWIKRLFKKENFWPLLIVVSFALLAGRSLIFESGYFNMHDDLQMMRQLEMEKCFLDGQIPCRWVPDMGYGYGFPLFNFYPPLPYLVGEVFRIMQFSFVDTAKLTFALSFVLSGITMYFLSKEFFGKWGGVISAVFYIWAPYHSVDIYVRGAMNESWGFVWFPLILWTSYRLIIERKRVSSWLIGLALSWAGLLLSHNVMVMIFTPVFAVWVFGFWIQDRNWKKFFQLFSSGVLALGLSSFFTLPAIFEQKYVHVDSLVQGYYEYIAHFASIGQLLTARYWGYGASIWGPNDGMPFQIGQLHWVLSIVVILFLLISRVKKNKFPNYSLYTILFSLSVGWFAAFMAHQNSTFIWQHIKPLAFVQFPWRFLTLAVFGLSFSLGSLSILLKPFDKVRIVAPSLLIILLVIINWNYFLPQGGKMGSLTDEQKFSGVAWNMQKTAGIFDYLPLTAVRNPKDPPNGLAEVVTGKGVVVSSDQGTNWATFDINLSTDSVIRINLFQFPNWKVVVDGNTDDVYIPKTEDYGRMYINIPKGNHSVSLNLENTPIRSFSNIISLITWVSLFGYTLLKKKNENRRILSNL